MAKVYAYPTKRKLPKGMEESLRKVAKDYVETLYATLALLDTQADKPTYDEVMEMVAEAFTDGIYDAIEELDES